MVNNARIPDDTLLTGPPFSRQSLGLSYLIFRHPGRHIVPTPHDIRTNVSVWNEGGLLH